VLPYAAALLRSGRPAERVVAEVEQRVARLTPTVRFMLGTALSEAGEVAAAESQFRQVLESQPRSGAARVALAETLLAERRYGEAAAAAAALPEDDPVAVPAIRSELFGRIVAGDLAGASESCTRATRVGLPAAELELFVGWIGLLAGEGIARPLPMAAVSLLELILEALLRVEEFKAFEALHPLVGLSELPVREQHELLAGLYLRRGFLTSAGQEWMAVCEQQPDARAMLGLARVAAAHGLPEDSANFAAEALSLEPTNGPARALLDTHRATVMT
jgi:tetratricopeptide (TPR) repeat protein